MNDSGASASHRQYACSAIQTRQPAARTLKGLDWLNFFLADVQTGVGPFLAIYLAKHGWNEELVGSALAISGVAGIVSQTPAGALVDRTRAERAPEARRRTPLR